MTLSCSDIQVNPDEEKRCVAKMGSSQTLLNFLAGLSFSGQALNIGGQGNANNAYLSLTRSCGKITHSLLVDGLGGERKCQVDGCHHFLAVCPWQVTERQ